MVYLCSKEGPLEAPGSLVRVFRTKHASQARRTLGCVPQTLSGWRRALGCSYFAAQPLRSKQLTFLGRTLLQPRHSPSTAQPQAQHLSLKSSSC